MQHETHREPELSNSASTVRTNSCLLSSNGPEV